MFSIIAYHRILNTVPCACRSLFFTSLFASANPKFPLHPSLTPPQKEAEFCNMMNRRDKFGYESQSLIYSSVTWGFSQFDLPASQNKHYNTLFLGIVKNK